MFEVPLPMKPEELKTAAIEDYPAIFALGAVVSKLDKHKIIDEHRQGLRKHRASLLEKRAERNRPTSRQFSRQNCSPFPFKRGNPTLNGESKHTTAHRAHRPQMDQDPASNGASVFMTIL